MFLYMLCASYELVYQWGDLRIQQQVITLGVFQSHSHYMPIMILCSGGSWSFGKKWFLLYSGGGSHVCITQQMMKSYLIFGGTWLPICARVDVAIFSHSLRLFICILIFTLFSFTIFSSLNVFCSLYSQPLTLNVYGMYIQYLCFTLYSYWTANDLHITFIHLRLTHIHRSSAILMFLSNLLYWCCIRELLIQFTSCIPL